MSFRYKFSIVLIILGIMSAIMSFGGKKSSSLPPEEILTILSKGDFFITADQLAGMIIEQDSTLQIVDVRYPDKYKSLSIPGALNIPIPNLLEPGSTSIIGSENLKTIFYADDESLSTQAWMLSMQKGFRSVYVLKGGLAEWDSIVMRSAFSGEKITARENALFEKRYKARRLFTQWNEMPDSLKAGFFAAKKKKDRELVGGCE
jgi:rhodanese-related sulfurtransferase